VLTNTFPLSSRWVVFSNLFSLGRCSASGVSSSCPSTAATTWYYSLRSTTATTTVVSSPDGGELDDVFPSWRKSGIRVCPTTLLAAGGEDGATVARQEAAPHRLSVQSKSESRLEGEVNRANLKFINLSTTTSRVSVRNINESEREGAKQIMSK
jgi:hypothetical protein